MKPLLRPELERTKRGHRSIMIGDPFVMLAYLQVKGVAEASSLFLLGRGFLLRDRLVLRTRENICQELTGE